MPTENQPSKTDKLATLPMWVIEQIKEQMSLSPAAWLAITAAVEQAEVPQVLPCEVKLPPGTVIGKGVPVSTLMLAIAQRQGRPAHSLAFAEQHQGEPVAIIGRDWQLLWFSPVGIETLAACCERTGLKIGDKLYRNADPGEVERLRDDLDECDGDRWKLRTERDTLRAQLAECEAMASMVAEREWAEHVGTGPVSSKVEAAFTQLHSELHEAQAKLAERNALLARAAKLARGMVVHPWAEEFARLAADIERIGVSASAEPSVPKCEACKGNGVIGWRRGQTAESYEEGESPCEDCNATGYAHTNGMPVSGACTTCNGLGIVPDGEIVGLDGVEFANGPVECVKDCPDCKPSAPVEIDERAAFERAFVVQEGVFFSRERNEYRSMNGRNIEETDSIDLNLRLSGWMSRAALEGSKPTVLSKCVLCDQLQADLTARDERIDMLEKQVQLADHWLEFASFNNVGEPVEHTQEMRDEFRKKMIAAVFPGYVEASTHGRLNGVTP